MKRRQFLRLAAGAAAFPLVGRVAWAQAYPTRPVRIIVPVAPGGALDIIARIVGQQLSGRLGQPFVIENRPGAGTNIGIEAAVRAPADGYTLLLIPQSVTTNATLYDKLNFDFIRDIAPVASISRVPVSWWYIRRFRLRRFQRSSPMPRPIRAISTWPPPAGERPPTSPASCLR